MFPTAERLRTLAHDWTALCGPIVGRVAATHPTPAAGCVNFPQTVEKVRFPNRGDGMYGSQGFCGSISQIEPL